MKEFFPVAKLKERYGIGKQADINRRKHLGIVPQKIDGVYVISKEQLGMLDGLDQFLKSTPKAKMTDFPVEPTGTSVPSGRAVMDATLVDDNESSLVHQQEEEEEPPADLVQLVETIAHSISPPNPISHWEKLQWLVDNEIIISTAEVQALVGTKPKGDRWTRGSFTFEKAGKLGTQLGWKVSKT